jgi:ketosteroid isomerase-like protein
MSANLGLVRSAYADWERGDFSRADWADPDIEFVLADGPEPGQWTGVAVMATAWSDRLSAFDDYRTEAREYRSLDDERILVLVGHTGRGKSSGVEMADVGQPAALFHVRNGRVTRLVVYLDPDRALADLGLTPEDASPSSSSRT